MRWTFGVQCAREALHAHGAAVAEVLLASDSPTTAGLARLAAHHGVRVDRTDKARLDRLAQGGLHQGVAARVPDLRLLDVSDVVASKTLIVALDEIQDPHNFGAIVRSAVALAEGVVLFGRHGAAPLTPATFRASAGAIEHATLVEVRSLRSALAELREAGWAVVALDGSGTQALSAVDLRAPTVLVIGSEGEGVRRSVREGASTVARIPMTPRIGSLNASVAAAVSLYEACRQRGT